MNHRLQAYLLQCIDHDEVTVDQAADETTYSNLNADDILKVFYKELTVNGLLDILEQVKDHQIDDNELFVSTHILRDLALKHGAIFKPLAQYIREQGHAAGLWTRRPKGES